MKAAAFACLALLVLPAAAEDCRTRSGRLFRDCRIVRVDPDGVAILHATGAAKLAIAELPAAWQRRCKLPPAPVTALAGKPQATRHQAAAARRQRDAELGAALAEARQRELDRIARQEAEARANLAAAATADAPSLVPALPELGLALDGRDARRGARRDTYGLGFPGLEGCGFWPWGGWQTRFYSPAATFQRCAGGMTLRIGR